MAAASMKTIMQSLAKTLSSGGKSAELKNSLLVKRVYKRISEITLGKAKVTASKSKGLLKNVRNTRVQSKEIKIVPSRRVLKKPSLKIYNSIRSFGSSSCNLQRRSDPRYRFGPGKISGAAVEKHLNIERNQNMLMKSKLERVRGATQVSTCIQSDLMPLDDETRNLIAVRTEEAEAFRSWELHRPEGSNNPREAERVIKFSRLQKQYGHLNFLKNQIRTYCPGLASPQRSQSNTASTPRSVSLSNAYRESNKDQYDRLVRYYSAVRQPEPQVSRELSAAEAKEMGPPPPPSTKLVRAKKPNVVESKQIPEDACFSASTLLFNSAKPPLGEIKNTYVKVGKKTPTTQLCRGKKSAMVTSKRNHTKPSSSQRLLVNVSMAKQSPESTRAATAREGPEEHARKNMPGKDFDSTKFSRKNGSLVTMFAEPSLSRTTRKGPSPKASKLKVKNSKLSITVARHYHVADGTGTRTKGSGTSVVRLDKGVSGRKPKILIRTTEYRKNAKPPGLPKGKGAIAMALAAGSGKLPAWNRVNRLNYTYLDDKSYVYK